MRLRKPLLPALLLGGLLLACAPALYLPTEEMAARQAKSLGDLRRGRQAYIDHCGSCHNLYLPAQFTPGDWTRHIREMGPRAHADSLQQRLILDYILAGK